MADYKVTDTELIAVANAIRTKGGTSGLLEWPNGYISAINAIPGPGPEIVSWADGTDAQIVALIQAAHNGDIDLQQDAGWALGDIRNISIASFVDGSGKTWPAVTMPIVISSFSDYSSCGCVMQFDFKKAYNDGSGGCRINSTATNSGGYPASEMYLTTIPAIVNALPEWLKNLLIEFSCVSGAGGSWSQVTAQNCKLALRSECEILSSRNYSTGEGSRIPYYALSGNNGAKNGTGVAYSVMYWTRSPTVNGSNWTTIKSTGGASDWYDPTTKMGIAPFGCI